MTFSNNPLRICIVAVVSLVAGLSGFEFSPTARKVVVEVAAGMPSHVQFAAKELADHYEQATGVPVEILAEGAAIPEGAFVFRLHSAPADSGLLLEHALITCTEDCYDIAGNNENGSQGTRFAVYDWLDSALGVLWLWPGDNGTVVPKTDVVRFEEGSREYGPKLLLTCWRPCADHRDLWATYKGWEHFFSTQQLWEDRNRMFNDMSYQNYPHAFESWWGKYGADHPEWFQMLPDGTRRPDPTYCGGHPMYITMCVSNPELVKQVVQNWLEDPNAKLYPHINLNEDDSPGRCTCDACMAWDESPVPTAERRAKALARFKAGDANWCQELGSLSLRYARFYMAVLAEADRVAPEKHANIAGLVYANYYIAPDFQMSDRIIQRYCPPIMFPWTPEKLERYKREWQGWRKTGCRLMMRPNFTLDGHNFPVNYAAQYAECFRFAYENNLIGYDQDSLTGQYAVQGTTIYTVARIQCHPEMTNEQMADEYCSAFGAAAGEVKAYFARLAEITENAYTVYRREGVNMSSGAPEDGDYGRFHMAGHLIFTRPIFAELFERLARAEGLVHEDKVARKRVKWLRRGLEHSQMVAEAQIAFQHYQASGDIAPFAAAIDKLDHFRDSHEYDNLSNFGFLRWLEQMHWPVNQARQSLGK